ncbi:hypothetical protein CHARACLAT_014605 [Characodon lateralis]|uniref:CLEC16A/TT9 C-terminal domain-containing protein n=1 Tax=Characodon lateralis TaxID=208331 RepID=A0ABU7ETQ6_9TELE|nr:hypothetical protein [Characodon lateralis]
MCSMTVDKDSLDAIFSVLNITTHNSHAGCVCLVAETFLSLSSAVSIFCRSLDDGAYLEHTPSSSSGCEGEGGGGEPPSTPSNPVPVPALAPSLTPASQPTISLLTDSNADTLSVESLTLLPPADSPHLHPCAATHSLPRPDASIIEEEKEAYREREEELQEEDGSLMDETDATVKDETTETTDLITPTDEGPEGADEQGEDTSFEVERANRAATESVEKTVDAEIHKESAESPELD